MWGVRGASQNFRMVEKLLKPFPVEPISNSKESNMLERRYFSSEELSLMPGGRSVFSCGAVWEAGAAWTPETAGDPPPAGAAWGCSRADAAPPNEGHWWIQ